MTGCNSINRVDETRKIYISRQPKGPKNIVCPIWIAGTTFAAFSAQFVLGKKSLLHRRQLEKVGRRFCTFQGNGLWARGRRYTAKQGV